MVMCQNIYAADQWTVAAVTGSTDPSDLDIILDEQFGAVDRMLRGYRKNVSVIPSTSTQVTILPGELMICNSDGTDCEMRRSTSNITVTTADLDTGSSFTDATYHYVYATADTDIDGFVEKVSISSTAPAGATQYRMIGGFYYTTAGGITSVGSVSGGDVASHSFVKKNGSISTTSSSYADMTDMQLYYYSSGRPLEMVWSGILQNTLHGYCYVTFDVDGTDYGVGSYFGTPTDEGRELVIHRTVAEDLTPGLKNIKVQWKSSTATCNSYSDSDRSLQVKEL